MVRGATAVMIGDVGGAQANRSADPDRDVEALLPCLATMRSALARIEDVVEMLKVLCESPPVPTMSTWKSVSLTPPNASGLAQRMVHEVQPQAIV